MAIGLLTVRTSVAYADPKTCAAGAVYDATDCNKVEKPVVIHLPIVPAGPVAVSTRPPSPSGPATVYVPYNRLGTGPDGKPCATTGYVEQGVVPTDEQLLIDPNPLESNVPITGNYLSILEIYPPCPQQPRLPGQPEPVETKAMVAARHWADHVPLPKPKPAIAPGRAITGKPAYLETRGEVAQTYRADTVFGPLLIVAAGSYTVDWGDGTSTGPHALEGKAWPAGEITHDYLNIGSYNVLVTEKWTATWSIDGDSGVLRTLQTTGRIDNFPVQQLQAVVGR